MELDKKRITRFRFIEALLLEHGTSVELIYTELTGSPYRRSFDC